MVKLSNGEFIHPERLETLYDQSTYIRQIFVHGDSYMPNAVAIVHPNFDVLQPKFPDLSPADICRDKAANLVVFQDIAKFGKLAQLKNFEKVTQVRLVETPFTVDNGLLTPTQKLNRHMARKKFKKEIRRMYRETLNKTI
jgi:long-chain acyl-CoA synthetase